MKKQAFSSEQYLNLQRDHILERINQFDGKLYLEFGGKMLEDFHAARVLPGYEPDNKIKLLQEFKDQVEVVIAINASNIEHSKPRTICWRSGYRRFASWHWHGLWLFRRWSFRQGCRDYPWA